MSTIVTYPPSAGVTNPTVDQGDPAPNSDAWPVKITDGTNTAALANVVNTQYVNPSPGQSLATATTILGWDGTAHREILVSPTGQLALSFADVTVTGAITSNQSVTLVAGGLSSAAITFTGVWSGPLNLEASIDGVSFVPATGVTLTGGFTGSVFSSPNSIQVNVSAFTAVRIRGAVASGTANVTIRANSTAGPVVLSESLPQGGNVIGLVGQSGTWTVTSNDAGFIRANPPTRINYVSTPVTTAAYTTLVASMGATTKEIEIFDSSGQTLVLATGAAASEVDQIFVFPGGNGRVKLAITSGTRVSIKAVSATANVGEISSNWYG